MSRRVWQLFFVALTAAAVQAQQIQGTTTRGSLLSGPLDTRPRLCGYGGKNKR